MENDNIKSKKYTQIYTEEVEKHSYQNGRMLKKIYYK